LNFDYFDGKIVKREENYNHVKNMLKKINFTKGQKEIIDIILKGVDNDFRDKKIYVFSGKAGCVDRDTEFFCETGWKKISSYKEGDKVLQYNSDGTSELVFPTEFHKYPEDNMTLMKNKHGINQCLSDEHDIVFVNRSNNVTKLNIKEVESNHKQNKSGFGGKFIHSFTPKVSTKLELTEPEIKLMFINFMIGELNLEGKGVIYLKENREKIRLNAILKKSNLEYQVKSFGKVERYTFTPPRNESSFTTEWFKCSVSQLNIIYNELLFWNKNTPNKIFVKGKINADFIQYVLTSFGKRAQIFKINTANTRFKNINIFDKRETEYFVEYFDKNLSLLLGSTKEEIENKNNLFSNYKTKDGFKYCFSVPSGMLILRREGSINITGNSGKTFTLSTVLKAFKMLNIETLTGTFTGKASQVLREKGVESYTLHSLMYKPNVDKYGKIIGWRKNETLNCDILFVDEYSMLSKELIEDILSYNKITIFFGDNKQLPPIGEQSLYLEDKTDVELTEICRQAKGNPIIKWANFVRDGNLLFKGIRDKSGDGIFATLDKNKDIDLIEKLKKTYTQMICGTNKMRHSLNQEYRKNMGYKEELYVGETLVVLKNDRNNEVFNGQILTITELVGKPYKDEIGLVVQDVKTDCGDYTIYFEGLNNIEFNPNEITKLKQKDYNFPVLVNYSYALTVFKLQGSQSDKVLIFAYDMWFMYYRAENKKIGKEMMCRALYTAITRGIKKCIVVF